MNFRTLDYRAMAEGYLSAEVPIATLQTTPSLDAADTFSLIEAALHLNDTVAYQFGFLGHLFEHDAKLSIIDPSTASSRPFLPAYGIRAFLDQNPDSDTLFTLHSLSLPFLRRAQAAVTGENINKQHFFVPMPIRKLLASQFFSSTLFSNDEIQDTISTLQVHRTVKVIPKGDDPGEDSLGFHHVRFNSELEAILLEQEMPPLPDDQTQAQAPKRLSL